MNATVVIITLKRPDCVERCLECLQRQTHMPAQVVVVDASPDELTSDVVSRFEGVMYLRNSSGFGRMTTSRNIALARSTSEIIAFLDDDAFAHPHWLEHLLAAYRSPDIGAVGGRALNSQPGEASAGREEIGLVKRDGFITGNFAADPGRAIEVDHVMGCNMSFRRKVLAELGGFREDYPGISGLREDTDMCLRVRRLGYKVIFTPEAIVDHIGAPQAIGRRFDARYAFYSAQNHCILLQRNYGLFSDKLLRFLCCALWRTTVELARKIVGALVRAAAGFFGLIVGSGKAVLRAALCDNGPTRKDEEGNKLRKILSIRVGACEETEC